MPGAPKTDLPVLLPVAEASHRQALVERREGAPLLIVDIGMPREIWSPVT